MNFDQFVTSFFESSFCHSLDIKTLSLLDQKFSFERTTYEFFFVIWSPKNNDGIWCSILGLKCIHLSRILLFGIRQDTNVELLPYWPKFTRISLKSWSACFAWLEGLVMVIFPSLSMVNSLLRLNFFQTADQLHRQH